MAQNELLDDQDENMEIEVLPPSLIEDDLGDREDCTDRIHTEHPDFALARQQGVVLVDYQLSQCEGEEGLDFDHRISSIDRAGDTLIFSFDFQKNCCSATRARLVVTEQKRWNFVLHQPEECSFCFCTCCFSAEMKVISSQPLPTEFEMNGREIKVSADPIPMVTFENDLWPNGNLKEKRMYRAGVLKSHIRYDQTGTPIMKVWVGPDGKMLHKREYPMQPD